MERLAQTSRGSAIAASAIVMAAPNDTEPTGRVRTLNTGDHDCESGLERLPAEIRRHVLSVLDLHCLKALVRASPTFHEQYLHDRRHLLSASLEVTLGCASLDAFATQKAKAQNQYTLEYVTGVLETWREKLPYRSSFQLAGAITEDEAVDMVYSYFETVMPVAENFIEDALEDFEKQVGEFTDKAESQPELSNIEWQRWLRATYRFELLCWVTDPNMPGLTCEIAANNATCLFFTPEPWEGEELFTFYQLVEHFYEKVWGQITMGIDLDNPRFDDQDRSHALVGAFDINDSGKPRIEST